MLPLNMMRMICDRPGIMKNSQGHDCPNMEELARILEEAQPLAAQATEAKAATLEGIAA
jgi:hypothetical protein